MVDESDIAVLALSLKIVAFISLIALFVMIISIFKWGNLKSFGHELIIILFAIEFLKTISFLFPIDDERKEITNLCITQSFFRIFFQSASDLWILCIAFTAWYSFNTTELIDYSKCKYRTIYFLCTFIPCIILEIM